jgi:hypothetical protein
VAASGRDRFVHGWRDPIELGLEALHSLPETILDDI